MNVDRFPTVSPRVFHIYVNVYSKVSYIIEARCTRREPRRLVSLYHISELISRFQVLHPQSLTPPQFYMEPHGTAIFNKNILFQTLLLYFLRSGSMLKSGGVWVVGAANIFLASASLGTSSTQVSKKWDQKPTQ